MHIFLFCFLITFLAQTHGPYYKYFFFHIHKQEYMLVKTLILQDIPKEQDCLPHRWRFKFGLIVQDVVCSLHLATSTHKSEPHRPICFMLATNQPTSVLRYLS